MIICNGIYDDKKVNDSLLNLLLPMFRVKIENIESSLADLRGECMDIRLTFNAAERLTINNAEQLSVLLSDLDRLLTGLTFFRLVSIADMSNYTGSETLTGTYQVRLRTESERLYHFIKPALVVDLQEIDKQLEDGDYIVRLEDKGYIIRRIANHVGENKIYIDEVFAQTNPAVKDMANGEVKKIPEMPSSC